jgi:ATP-dependent DNA helicase RecQ
VCCNDDGREATMGDPAIATDTVVEHREWGRGVVLDGDSDRLVVLFDEYGYRALDLDAVRSGGLLRVP